MHTDMGIGNIFSVHLSMMLSRGLDIFFDPFHSFLFHTIYFIFFDTIGVICFVCQTHFVSTDSFVRIYCV